MPHWKVNESRQEIIDHFGGECVQCGFSDSRALQFDHINDDGVADRARWNGAIPQVQLLLHPEKYQLLCANCNQIKRYVSGDRQAWFPRPNNRLDDVRRCLKDGMLLKEAVAICVEKLGYSPKASYALIARVTTRERIGYGDRNGKIITLS